MSGKRHSMKEYARALELVEPTPLVREIMERRLAGEGMREVCKEMDIQPANAYEYVRRVLRRAAKIDGWPEAAPDGIAPEGYIILKRVRHGLLGKSIKPDGMVVMWFTDEGGVEYEQGEGLSLDQVVSLAALVQSKAVQEFFSE